MSTGDNEMRVEKTAFVNCTSKTKCAGLRKTGGSLCMKCCGFVECYGVNGDTSILGTAMGSTDCTNAAEDVTFAVCWREPSPHADNTYGFLRGRADVERINITDCESADGGLLGCFNNVEKESPIRYIQGINGQEYDAFETWYSDQTLYNVNLINNSFTDTFFNPVSSKIVIRGGCFFLNNRYNDYGTVNAFDCVSDSYSKATKSTHLTSLQFVVKQCRMSSNFTCGGEHKFPFVILFLIFALLLLSQ